MKTLLSILAAGFFIAPVSTHARDIIHKGDVVVIELHGEFAP